MKVSLEVVECHRCSLRCDGITPVAGKGGPSDVVFVSYAPDAETNLMGEPFSNTHEKHFRNLMERAGVEGHFTYLVKCHGETKAEHITTCKAWLKKEIKECGARLVIALGQGVADVLVKNGINCLIWYPTHRIFSGSRTFDAITVEFLKGVRNVRLSA